MHGNRRSLFLGGLAALLCAQILYGALMLSALYKQYEGPVVQVNALLCRDISDHLSLLVRVGKSLRPQTVDRFLAWAIMELSYIQGFCYTQLTDVMQEVNGLLTPDRKPKVDFSRMAEINRSFVGMGRW